jgi:hypothetical protein
MRAELEEQRDLIEQQENQIRRLERRLEVQMRFTAHLQTEINDIKATVQRASRTVRPMREVHLEGNQHRQERHLSNETTSGRDPQS